MTRPILRPKLRFAALIAATLTVVAVACGDFTGVPASLPTLTDSGVVYAINGAPPGAPSALHVFSGTLLSADANFVFDVAFDINSAGSVVVLPERAVASGLATTHTVSLQASNTAFTAIDARQRAVIVPARRCRRRSQNDIVQTRIRTPAASRRSTTACPEFS